MFLTFSNMKMSVNLSIFIAGFVLACNADHSGDLSEIAAIKDTLSNQAMYIEGLTNAFTEYKKSTYIEIDDLKQRVHQLEGDNKALLKTKDGENEDPSRNKRFLLDNADGDGMYPAFTAKLSKNITGLGNNQIIVFDNIVSNIRNGYSPLTGVFTSPTNGTYFFFSSLMSHKDDHLEAEMVKNGHQLVTMYGYGNQRYDQGVNAAVTRLSIGDKVWVRNLNEISKRVYGDYWSTFLGFQI